MRVNVSDLFSSEVGTSRFFRISDERPDWADIDLSQGLNGQVELVKLADHIQATGKTSAQLDSTCDRCLRPFKQTIKFGFTGAFSEHPTEDEWPVDGRLNIDLEPLLHQELLVALPLALSCGSDCPGPEVEL